MTGEVLDERWRGWDTSDPALPAWLGPDAIPLPNRLPKTTKTACA